MEKIIAKIGWSDNNYSCISDDPQINGIVVVTHKKLESLKAKFKETFKFHIEGCAQSGDKINEWLVAGEYEIEYTYEVSALLHRLDGIVSRAAIARATGINERQIGHYASGLHKPRTDQRKRIIEGIHNIGEQLLQVI
jgi:hypothetical protein